MDLNVFTTIGGNYKAFAGFIIKRFDNACHFFGTNKILVKISTGELYINRTIKLSI